MFGKINQEDAQIDVYNRDVATDLFFAIFNFFPTRHSPPYSGSHNEILYDGVIDFDGFQSPTDSWGRRLRDKLDASAAEWQNKYDINREVLVDLQDRLANDDGDAFEFNFYEEEVREFAKLYVAAGMGNYDPKKEWGHDSSEFLLISDSFKPKYLSKTPIEPFVFMWEGEFEGDVELQEKPLYKIVGSQPVLSGEEILGYTSRFSPRFETSVV